MKTRIIKTNRILSIIGCALVSSWFVMTSVSIAQPIRQPASDEVDLCHEAILKQGLESGTLIKGEFGEYTLQATNEDWLSKTQICNFSYAYIDISPISTQDRDHFKFRMRHVNYIYKEDISKISYYTPWMDEVNFKKFIFQMRVQSPTKEVVLGNIIAKKYFQMVTLKTDKNEVELASIESELPSRIAQCKKDIESFTGSDGLYTCDETSFDVSLNWVYNQFISMTVSQDMEGAKFSMTTNSIVQFDGTKISPIKDLRDLFGEKAILSALKKDWIIRNSNKWKGFANAESWESFWNFKSEELYNYRGLTSLFQSYSNRLSSKQIKEVEKCASLAGNNTATNSGFKCVGKINPRIYIFNYRIDTTSVSKDFSIIKMNSDSVVIGLTLLSDATGSSTMRLPIIKKGSSKDFFSNKIDL